MIKIKKPRKSIRPLRIIRTADELAEFMGASYEPYDRGANPEHYQYQSSFAPCHNSKSGTSFHFGDYNGIPGEGLMVGCWSCLQDCWRDAENGLSDDDLEVRLAIRFQNGQIAYNPDNVLNSTNGSSAIKEPPDTDPRCDFYPNMSLIDIMKSPVHFVGFEKRGLVWSDSGRRYAWTQSCVKSRVDDGINPRSANS